MKAEELRLGNKILFLGEVVTVECIDNLPERPDMYWLKVKEQSIKHKIFQFKPIPLTEDWLLRMGFVKQKSFSGMFSKKTKSGAWFSVVHHEEHVGIHDYDGRELKKWWQVSGDNFDNAFNAVHQLQNIYYFGTAQELTIKL